MSKSKFTIVLQKVIHTKLLVQQLYLIQHVGAGRNLERLIRLDDISVNGTGTSTSRPSDGRRELDIFIVIPGLHGHVAYTAAVPHDADQHEALEIASANEVAHRARVHGLPMPHHLHSSFGNGTHVWRRRWRRWTRRWRGWRRHWG